MEIAFRLLLVLLTCVFPCIRPPAALAISASSDPMKVGIVLSIGGLGDNSFNDATYAGIQKLRQHPNCRVEVIEPGDVSSIEPALEFLSQRKLDLIVGVGIFANDPIRQVATRHPDLAYALFDSVVTLPNVQSILFNEEEGSFYAGAFAGLLSKSGTIGFLGGMVSPVIQGFEKGFRNGIAFVNPKAVLITRYAGDTPEAFNVPDIGYRLGKELAAQQADFIFHASGKTGLGLIKAARQGTFMVIGVDSDQSVLAPGKVAASMVKRLDVALDKVVRMVSEHRFKGGVLTLGFADAGIELVISRFNKNLLTPIIQERLREVESFLLHK